MLEIGTLKFLVQQWTMGFPVPDEPHFDPESTPYFLDKLAKAKFYLEYGAGGSTIQAARMGKTFCTVEGDPYFLNGVKQKIGNVPGATLLHANIGMTQRWGWPVMTAPTPARMRKWKGYATLPWQSMEGRKPDLILIDGRFRILCALTSIANMDGQDFEMLFDDYSDRRSHYGIVEQYAELTGFAGRMAIFKPKQFDAENLSLEILKHITDFS